MSKPCWRGKPGRPARVLVTGVGGNVAQGILKCLDESGLAGWVVGTDANPLSMGLYAVDRGYVTPLADDPAFAGEMIRIIRTEKIQAVFVGADAETLHLAKIKDRLEEVGRARIIVGPHQVVARCADKWLTAQWFEELGLPHPPTVLADDKTAVIGLAKRAGFPLIAKPRNGFASRGQVIIEDRAELENILPRLNQEAVVQKLIGREDGEYTAATFSTAPGRVEAVIVLRRQLLQGTSYRIETVSNPALTEEVARWGRALGGVGPLNFQFRLTDSGPVCFEVNPRFSGTVGVRRFFGYNDPTMALRAFVFGQEVTQPEIRPGVVFRYWEEMFLPGLDFDRMARKRMVDGDDPAEES